MNIPVARPLFAWDCLEDSPSLQTVRQFLHSLPDGKLLDALRRGRGKGRNDYPVTALWGTVLLKPLLRHTSMEACLGELRRNAGLRALIGIDCEAKVPRKWNVSRFEVVLGSPPYVDMMHEIFDSMVQALAVAVPDLGQSVSGDSSSLSCHAAASPNKHGLPEPDGGKKEYTDEKGNIVRVLKWFGYKFHMLVDTRHEVALSYRVSSATRHDSQELPAMLTQARINLGDDVENKPDVSRIQTLAYDKAADDEETHAMLNAANILPLIENRSLWKTDHERMLDGHDGTSNVVYDEAGTLFCYDKVSDPPVRHKMSYIGLEKKRGTLKYRCPAMHEGWTCPSQNRCNEGLRYGKCARIKREQDLRRFPPIPRATKQFERLYKGRTASERVNARIKLFWGADDGNLTGAPRFHAMLGAAMIAHIGLATLLAATPRREGTLGKTTLGKTTLGKTTLGQTNLSPIAKALHVANASRATQPMA